VTRRRQLFGEVVALDYDPEAKTGMIEFALRKSAEQVRRLLPRIPLEGID